MSGQASVPRFGDRAFTGIVYFLWLVSVTILVKGMVPALCGSFGMAPGMRQVRAKPDPGLRAKLATLQPETELSLPTYRTVS